MTREEHYILVVEDDPMVNRMLTKHLSYRGFECKSAHSVAEATRLLAEEHPPRIIVLDLQLEDGSGQDVLKVMQDARFDNTDVIVASGKAFSPGQGLTDKHVKHVLMKPVSPRALGALVNTITMGDKDTSKDEASGV